MIRLNNGKYLVAGGNNYYGTVVGTTEIFDASIGRTSVLGPPMTDWRCRHTADMIGGASKAALATQNKKEAGSTPASKCVDERSTAVETL
jgi:hypothetical protein